MLSGKVLNNCCLSKKVYKKGRVVSPLITLRCPSTCQGCSQKKWNAVHGISAQTRFTQKKIYNQCFFVIHYHLVNCEDLPLKVNK